MDIRELSEHEIVIYGTGYIGEKFYKVLQANQMEKNILCFVKSVYSQGEVKFGFQVKSMGEVDVHPNTLICVAVHESNLNEVVEIVKKYTNRYIWIYPFLYEWLLGGIQEIDKKTQIRDLLQKCNHDLRMAIRLVAIECYYGLNNFGEDIYLRAEGIHCSKETAMKRLSCFKRLISSWEENGFNEDYAIGINQMGQIIDGNHRTSLAIYHQIESITCNVYRTKLSPVEIHGPEAMIEEVALRQNGFQEDEIARLWSVQKRYYKFYN